MTRHGSRGVSNSLRYWSRLLPPLACGSRHLPLLYTALFGLGVISALFGPVKYGILPDLLAKQELMAGNALVEAATFIAIFLGLIAGGLSARGRAPEGTVLQLMVIAIACFAASLFIPPTERAAPGLRANRNVLASTFALIARSGARCNPLDKDHGGLLVLDERRDRPLAGAGRRPQQDGRRHRGRDGGERAVRARHRNRLDRGGGDRAWAHLFEAGSFRRVSAWRRF